MSAQEQVRIRFCETDRPVQAIDTLLQVIATYTGADIGVLRMDQTHMFADVLINTDAVADLSDPLRNLDGNFSRVNGAENSGVTRTIKPR